MEDMQKVNKDSFIGCYVTDEMKKEIYILCKKKNWKVSSFFRVCIEKEMERLKDGQCTQK